jgi:release factor glutamine methyltransferase
MRFKEAKVILTDQLSKIYSEREAENIVRILFEDLFDYKLAKQDSDLTLDELADYQEATKRLLVGEPLSYVTGLADFYGLQLEINSSVLIPRPETEELVHWVLDEYKSSHLQLDLMDIGTGSGCIALALKKKKPNFRIFALEISLDALNVARLNARRLGILIEIMRIDILDKELWPVLGKMDIIVSNPPYIHESEKDLLLKQVVDYEPALALFVSDEDPLIYYKTIAEFGASHLNDGGKLFIEISEFYGPKVVEILEKNNFSNIVVKKDMQGKDRMIRAGR